MEPGRAQGLPRLPPRPPKRVGVSAPGLSWAVMHELGPTPAQEDQGCPCARGHCARHSRAGRSSPAPRRRPQEPTINRVCKTS
ncbi:unnamed protein product [Rangifer tarandus platyrhynchus]|uniref:Uncharacterized protein n=2 Tax=Rangifer tarandus platyrhynchus TaxID=3082113 RepID=A0ACB0FN00_RANTA|nr:unnamed protein product [Rangifer tarandus platyrhynchus]CAI9713376.1 unnamed protein product [Rangifer tarandus platyrhynchus]